MLRIFALASLVFHAAAIMWALVVQALTIGTLPIPHRPLTFDTIRFIRVTDIQLPAPPRRTTPASSPDSAVRNENAAPTMAPPAVAPETGREGVAPSRTPIEGVERGAGSAIDTVIGTGVLPPPPPAPPPPTVPIRLHSGMTPPVKTVDVSPMYPAIAQRAHVEGVVILEAVIDALGRVESVRVLRSISLLDEAALDAVRQWRFTPARLNGDAVPVVMTVTVQFTLRDR